MTGAWDVGRRRLLLNDDFGDVWGSVSREDKNRELKGIMTATTQGWGFPNGVLFQSTHVEVGNRFDPLALLPSDAVLRN